jgi:hypothetical protein
LAKSQLTLKDLVSGTEGVLQTAKDKGSSQIDPNNIKITPFLGTKTLKVTAEYPSDSSNSAYKTGIEFYNVEGGEKPKWDESAVRVRCSCKNFYFVFAYPNWKADALLGTKPKTYTPVANPKRKVGPWNPSNIPGGCKHIHRLANYLSDTGEIE